MQITDNYYGITCLGVFVPPQTKKPRYPANPDAPTFTPDLWVLPNSRNADHPNGIMVNSNCYQYAIAGSNADGSNVTYHESIPNPGERDGTMEGTDKFRPARMRELLEIDGLTPASTRAESLPPSKPGFYIVGTYIKNLRPSKEHPDGARDYHFMRQDADGGWSHKPGQGYHITVERFREPDKDGGYRTLPERFGVKNNYKFIGYAYVPKAGIDAGLEEPLITTILAQRAKNPESCDAPNAVLNRFLSASLPINTDLLTHVRNIGIIMRKHRIPEAVEAYEACLDAYVKDLKKPLLESELAIDQR